MVSDPALGEHLFWVYWVHGPREEKIVIEHIRVAAVDDPGYPTVESSFSSKANASATNLFRDRDEAEWEAAARILAQE